MQCLKIFPYLPSFLRFLPAALAECCKRRCFLDTMKSSPLLIAPSDGCIAAILNFRGAFELQQPFAAKVQPWPLLWLLLPFVHWPRPLLQEPSWPVQEFRAQMLPGTSRAETRSSTLASYIPKPSLSGPRHSKRAPKIPRGPQPQIPPGFSPWQSLTLGVPTVCALTSCPCWKGTFGNF